MCGDTRLYAGGLVQALAFPTNLGPFGNALVRTHASPTERRLRFASCKATCAYLSHCPFSCQATLE